MTVGELARRILGPLTDPVARLYRSYFIDLDDFAAKVGKLEGVSSILEIGCGDGQVCEALAATFPRAEILGIDIADDPGALYRGRTHGVEFRQTRAEELAHHSSGHFDLVVLCDVLHHVPSPGRPDLVRTAWSLVRAGGHLVVKDWVASRDLTNALAYMSDRFISGDRPRFFDSHVDLSQLVLVNGASVVDEGQIRPRRNNRYVIARKPPPDRDLG